MFKSVFLLLLFSVLINIPMLVVLNMHNNDYFIEKKYEQEYEGCLDGFIDADIRYNLKNNGQSMTREESLLTMDDRLLSHCKEAANDKKALFDSSYYPLLFIFIIIPVSGSCSSIVKHILNSFKANKPALNLKFYAILISCLLLLALLFAVASSILMSVSLPNFIVPEIVSKFSLIVGLPFMITIVVLIEAFGRAFSSSGKRVHEELLNKISDKDEER